MKVLSLGLDSSIVRKNSQLRDRILDYGKMVDKYIAVAPNKKFSKEDLDNKISVFGSGGSNKLSQLLRIYYLSQKIIKKQKPDIVTVQDQYYLALLGWKLAKKYNLALEIQVHGFEKFSGLRKIVAKFVIKRANGVRVVSQRLRKRLMNEFGVDEEKIIVAPIYTDISHLASRISHRDYSKFVFLTVSRFVPVKNIEMQIEAMKEIVKKYPKTELWLVGDGPFRKNYELQITNYKLENNIKLLGWIDNPEKLSRLYSQADCFLLTSNSEGWGIVVVQAASHGLPIIMTDVGLAGEVIKNNESGLVVPVGNKKLLHSAMMAVVQDRNLSKKLGENARKAVEKLPNKEEILKMYLEGWQNALKNK